MTAKHQVTKENSTLVSELKSFGITNEHISRRLGITPDTLIKHYPYELETAQETANAKIASKLFKKAYEDEDLTAIIFWLKTRARWRTEDNTQNLEQNEDLKREIKQIRANLDAKNKKDY